MIRYHNKCFVIIKSKNFKGVKDTLLTKQQPLLNFQPSVTAATAKQKDAKSEEWENAKPFKDIPTMSNFTLFKNNLPGGKYANLDTTEFMMAVKQELGIISILPGSFGQALTVFTHNAEDFAKVFRSDGIWPKRTGLEAVNYHQSVHRADYFQGLGGLLATHGEVWSNLRSIVNPILMQPKTVRLYMHKIHDVTEEFLKRIRDIRDPNSLEMPSTFLEEINRFTLDSVAVVAFDKQLGLINKNRNDPLAKRMFDALSDFMTYSLDIELKPSIWRYIKTPAFNRVMTALDTILDVSNTYVNETFARVEQDRKDGKPEKPDSEKSVLEKVIDIDRRLATGLAIDMLMAGVDSTSSTLVGFLLSMAKNPEKQEKLREEVMKILPEKDSKIDENSIKEMPYLRACFKESIRLYPIFLTLGRETGADTVLSGYRVPKGTNVVMPHASFIHDDTLYPRSKEYLPERWLRAQPQPKNTSECPQSLKPNNPFTYLPFGFGPRSCIGRRLSELELELASLHLIRNFKIEFHYPTDKPFKSTFLHVPNIPLKFKFIDIEN